MRVNDYELLTAYIDGELTGDELLGVEPSIRTTVKESSGHWK